MFAVVMEAEIETVPNSSLEGHAVFTNTKNFHDIFEKNITNNPKVELAYARLSTDQDNFFNEIGLFWYETHQPYAHNTTLTPEKLIALKRIIFRGSQYHDLGKKLRWLAEKWYAQWHAKNKTLFSRNEVMNSDIHILWPLYGTKKDILHEYFVPKKYFHSFVSKLKSHITRHRMNVLNVTVREVKKDTISYLPYAKQDVYGLVCLFSQGQTREEEEKMQTFTQEMIDEIIKLGGTFYLPYRLHYTDHQLLSAYPEIKTWVNLKHKYDPDSLFQSQFFHYIQTLLAKE